MTPVTFLSLGPGDPELLTIKALKTLKDADVVIVPATRNNEGITKSRATDIISEWCDENRLMVYELPMLKDRQAVSLVYDRIFADCVRLFEEGRRVVVAVEGDVSIYASIHYVMERLEKAGIPVEQSAGIPSFIAAAASAGLSLVSQQQRLTILPGDADAEMLHQLLSSNQQPCGCRDETITMSGGSQRIPASEPTNRLSLLRKCRHARSLSYHAT